MSLSRRSIITLLDLVEIKLSGLEVFDREDAREQQALQSARVELTRLLTGEAAARNVVRLANTERVRSTVTV